MATHDAIDPVLVERFAHGNGTVFVGAGISLGARLPSWHKLMGPLRTDLGPAVGPGTSYLDIAELYEVKHSRSVLVQYLKERLGDVRFQLTKTHELIVGLPVQRIYTTNFDTLLEQASQKKQINRNVIFNASQVGFSDTSTLSIVKLHGDLSDPGSIVISARDFYSYFGKNPAVADLLKVELQTHTVLFLGYSFSDPNLGMILGNAANQSGAVRPLLYSLQLKPSELTVRAMSARGVKVIALDAAPGTAEADRAIEDWLRRFRQSLIAFERRKHTYPVDARVPREPSAPPVRKNPVRRTRMLERIKTGLQSDFRVVVVKGEAGIGKTQLVAEAAADSIHLPGTYMLDEAFEQIVWIRSALDDASRGHSLDHIFESIAAHVDTLLSDGDNGDIRKKQSQINMTLQERRLLIVIEDFEDPSSTFDHQKRLAGMEEPAEAERRRRFEEIQEWLENPGPYANPKSRIVVTSRNAIVAGFVVEIAKMDSEEAAELLSEHARGLVMRHNCPGFGQDTARKLLALTTGNPQAIKWALGLCNATGSTERLEALRLATPDDKIGAVFKVLIDAIMDVLQPSEKEVVVAMMVFPSEEWIALSLIESAVSSACDSLRQRESLRHHVAKCIKFGLIERDARTDAYLMHRTTKEVLLGYGITSQELDEVRERLANHLLEFLARDDVISRHPYIGEAYWNALVRDEMAKVDPYWPTIEALMRWAGTGPYLVKFALLLVHYMDSRFLNNQRMHFVRLALAALGPGEKRTRALLHIDALAWTFIEENRKDDARAEIAKGLALLDGKADSDLCALAHAWRARLDASDGRKVEANRNIKEAFRLAEGCEAEKPWIMARVEMMAGDVELMDGNPGEAVEHYTKSADYADRYGGEGDGYQTNPRIGLALMAVVNAKKEPDPVSMERARRRFMRLVENGQVATGRLYGQYGLALIAARENASREAIRQLEQIMREIRRRSTGNVLLALAEKSYQQLLDASHGG